MTSIKLEINGQPFEIELQDGVQVALEDGKMIVKRGGEESQQIPYIPYVPYYPSPYYPPIISPTVTWGNTTTGTITVSGQSASELLSTSFTVDPIQ